MSASGEFVWPVRVYYEDTDAGGVVYYANYLKYLERARTEWLRHLGYEQDSLLETDRIVFPVRRVEIDYLKPARFNEELKVRTRLCRNGSARLEFEHHIEDGNGAVLCRALVTVVCGDADDFRPRRIPDAISASIAAAL
jgi:acyl-CoA thioester hydrolase